MGLIGATEQNLLKLFEHLIQNPQTDLGYTDIMKMEASRVASRIIH